MKSRLNTLVQTQNNKKNSKKKQKKNNKKIPKTTVLPFTLQVNLKNQFKSNANRVKNNCGCGRKRKKSKIKSIIDHKAKTNKNFEKQKNIFMT